EEPARSRKLSGRLQLLEDLEGSLSQGLIAALDYFSKMGKGFVQAVHFRECNSVVEACGRQIRFEADGGFEVIAGFIEAIRRSEHAGKIAVGFGVVRLDPTALARCRLGELQIARL